MRARRRGSRRLQPLSCGSLPVRGWAPAPWVVASAANKPASLPRQPCLLASLLLDMLILLLSHSNMHNPMHSAALQMKEQAGVGRSRLAAALSRRLAALLLRLALPLAALALVLPLLLRGCRVATCGCVGCSPASCPCHRLGATATFLPRAACAALCCAACRQWRRTPPCLSRADPIGLSSLSMASWS